MGHCWPGTQKYWTLWSLFCVGLLLWPHWASLPELWKWWSAGQVKLSGEAISMIGANFHPEHLWASSRLRLRVTSLTHSLLLLGRNSTRAREGFRCQKKILSEMETHSYNLLQCCISLHCCISLWEKAWQGTIMYQTERWPLKLVNSAYLLNIIQDWCYYMGDYRREHLKCKIDWHHL